MTQHRTTKKTKQHNGVAPTPFFGMVLSIGYFIDCDWSPKSDLFVARKWKMAAKKKGPCVGPLPFASPHRNNSVLPRKHTSQEIIEGTVNKREVP